MPRTFRRGPLLFSDFYTVFFSSGAMLHQNSIATVEFLLQKSILQSLTTKYERPRGDEIIAFNFIVVVAV